MSQAALYGTCLSRELIQPGRARVMTAGEKAMAFVRGWGSHHQAPVYDVCVLVIIELSGQGEEVK